MNPNIGHTKVLINYQSTWSQPITPILLRKTSMLPISTYSMWYNVIAPFVHLDPSLYLAYLIGTKGLDSSIFRNYTSYVNGNVYPIIKQHVVPLTYIPYFVGNQFPIMVQLMTSKDKQPIQQLVNAPIPTTIQVITNLPTYVPRGSAHQPLDGRQLGDSLGRNLRKGYPLR